MGSDAGAFITGVNDAVRAAASVPAGMGEAGCGVRLPASSCDFFLLTHVFPAFSPLSAGGKGL